MNAGPRIEHGAEVVRLMVHPDQQGRGWGKALLDAAVAHATTLGLEFLMLSARGGTDLPRFYAAQGWTPVGVWPGTLRLGQGPDDLVPPPPALTHLGGGMMSQRAGSRRAQAGCAGLR